MRFRKVTHHEKNGWNYLLLPENKRDDTEESKWHTMYERIYNVAGLCLFRCIICTYLLGQFGKEREKNFWSWTNLTSRASKTFAARSLTHSLTHTLQSTLLTYVLRLRTCEWLDKKEKELQKKLPGNKNKKPERDVLHNLPIIGQNKYLILIKWSKALLEDTGACAHLNLVGMTNNA